MTGFDEQINNPQKTHMQEKRGNEDEYRRQQNYPH